MIDPLKIIEKYYPFGSEAHYVLLEHCEEVRDKALSIALKHPELNLDLKFIVEASLLHDIGIFLCDAPRIFCHGVHLYVEHGYLGADLLRKENMERHALVCERHTGVGLSLETIIKNNMPLPHRDMLPVSMEEKLICYADKFFSKTKLGKEHSLEHIRTSLAHFDEAGVKVFDEWQMLFEPEKSL